MFQITGTIRAKMPEVKVSDTFRKREFVITENSSQYPQHLSFQLVQDKCSLLDPYQEGETVKVSFNLRGREWKSPQGEMRYFNTLDAWRIERVAEQAPAAGAPPAGGGYASASVGAPPPSPVGAESYLNGQEDDLPF